MRLRRLAALGAMLAVGCSLGGAAHGGAPSPSRAAVVTALRALDSSGTAFHLDSSIAGGDTTERLQADGHVRRGNLEMTATAGATTASLVIFDGALYGEQPASSHWLVMSGGPATFLWPAARLSLLWESIQLSSSRASPFKVGADQLIALAGALAGSAPDAFGREARGEIRFRATGTRLRSWEVIVTGAGGLRLDSVLTPGGSNPLDIEPPPTATAGNVLSLLFAGGGTVA